MNLLDLNPPRARSVVEQWLEACGEPSYRANQVMEWLWRSPIRHWRDATNLPTELRAQLDREHPLPQAQLAAQQESSDGTVKSLWRFPDGASVESVMIPTRRRRTLCISSQVGCAYGCKFCATGTMGFGRHLAPWEISAQVRESVIVGERPDSVVFMGMGEPLHNWSAVDTALTILNDSAGLGIGARHITVSTVGLIPGLAKLAARSEQFRVAISLHAPTSDKRLALMPVERKYSLQSLMDALGAFARRVTFEYVMISGRNDSREDAESLAQLARPLAAHVNLLPLHPGGADPELKSSSGNTIKHFAAALRALGVNTTVRQSRGKDINAACGQLRLEFDRRKVVTQ